MAPHYLDQIPPDFSHPAVKELSSLLHENYDRSAEVKKIGMVHNVVRYVGDAIRYRTDTEEGSSGSPVFNEQWQVVALHHRWVRDSTGAATEIRSQERRIERVVAGLAAAGIE
jgi:hypothetical protein